MCINTLKNDRVGYSVCARTYMPRREYLWAVYSSWRPVEANENTNLIQKTFYWMSTVERGPFQQFLTVVLLKFCKNLNHYCITFDYFFRFRISDYVHKTQSSLYKVNNFLQFFIKRKLHLSICLLEYRKSNNSCILAITLVLHRGGILLRNVMWHFARVAAPCAGNVQDVFYGNSRSLRRVYLDPTLDDFFFFIVPMSLWKAALVHSAVNVRFCGIQGFDF